MDVVIHESSYCIKTMEMLCTSTESRRLVQEWANPHSRHNFCVRKTKSFNLFTSRVCVGCFVAH